MGYWSQNEEGNSFAEAESGEDMTWGDQPADIIDAAITEVKWVFIKDLGRLPTKKELMAGITFSTAVLEGLPETVEEAERLGQAAVDASDLTADEVDKIYYVATRGDESTPQRVIEAQATFRELVESFAPEKDD